MQRAFLGIIVNTVRIMNLEDSELKISIYGWYKSRKSYVLNLDKWEKSNKISLLFNYPNFYRYFCRRKINLCKEQE